jgi:hypothetical protein
MNVLNTLIYFYKIQFLQTSNRLLHSLTTMERHLQLDGARGLLGVHCDVIGMLKAQEDTRALLPSGLEKNIRVLQLCNCCVNVDLRFTKLCAFVNTVKLGYNELGC